MNDPDASRRGMAELCFDVIASGAKQSSLPIRNAKYGLPRSARNDDLKNRLGCLKIVVIAREGESGNPVFQRR
jgi:hypothetical protein